MSAELWIAILAGAVALSAPLILAGLGEGFVERAGRINLGIEGMMILGALAGVWGASIGGAGLGLLAGGVTGVLLAVLMNALVLRLHANEIVVGLGITMLGLGLSTYLFQLWVPAGDTNVSVETVPRAPIAGLESIPAIGRILFSQSPIVYATLLVLLAAWAVMRFTRFGLQIRAVGADPLASELRGVRSTRVGARALLLGGATAGLAGAVITVGAIGSFTPGITAGRGYIVLAIVIMGRSAPAGIALGALLFAFLQSFSLLAQSTGLQLPSELYQSLPYVVTLIVLVITSRSRLRALTRRLQTA